MAAGVTYEPIATTTLGSSTATISFSSISGSYTDLRLVFTGAVLFSNSDLRIRFNSDTTTSYSQTNLIANGTTASSDRQTSQSSLILSNALLTTTTTMMTLDIFSYAGSTNKTLLIKTTPSGAGFGVRRSTAGTWRNTSAITSISLESITSVAEFDTGATVTLYGITKA